ILLFMGHNPIWLMKPGDVVTSQAIDWLSKNSDKPFFLFVHYYDPHEPLDPPEPYASMYPPDTVDPESKSYEVEKYLADLHALYRGEVTKMDESIGDLFKWLNDKNLMQNTLVIIFADHGESFEHKYYGHTDSIYNYVTHVPMIIVDPNTESAGEKGKRVDTLVNLTDVFYTVLGFLKIDSSQFISLAQKDVRGAKNGWNHNLLGLIENPGNEKLSDERAGWNYVPTQSDLGWSISETSRPRYFGFMFPGNNLIYTPGCRNLEAYFHYYDIDNDPGEDNDLFKSVHWANEPFPDAPELLANWSSNQSPSSSGAVNPLIREQLKALGYVN
ncbi:MAG: sulfatase-like hydrolase/transferase, partial [bacterium]